VGLLPRARLAKPNIWPNRKRAGRGKWPAGASTAVACRRESSLPSSADDVGDQANDRERWPIKPEHKSRIVKRLLGIVTSSDAHRRRPVG